MGVLASIAVKKENVSSYRAVRDVLDAMNDQGRYSVMEICRVADEVEEIGRRVERIHSKSADFKAVGLSHGVSSMLKLVRNFRMMESLNLDVK